MAEMNESFSNNCTARAHNEKCLHCAFWFSTSCHDTNKARSNKRKVFYILVKDTEGKVVVSELHESSVDELAHIAQQ